MPGSGPYRIHERQARFFESPEWGQRRIEFGGIGSSGHGPKVSFTLFALGSSEGGATTARSPGLEEVRTIWSICLAFIRHKSDVCDGC
jgi:hypothetical protein